MKYGYFDNKNQEYVITTPKTPLPWINYLGCNEFFSLISNTCGGYSFYKDAKMLRLTRYRYNNVPYDSNGKYYYIKEGDCIWNPGWQPMKTSLDHYKCRHGIGYSRFISCKNDLEANVLAFVPLNDNCEINEVKLINRSDQPKKVQLFSYVEWCLWNADDDALNYQRNLNIADVEVLGSTIYHKTEYRERRKHYAFYSVNSPINGFDTRREVFLGLYNGAGEPDVVRNGYCTNSIVSGWSPIASHQIDISLEPNESRTFVFILAYVENQKDHKWEKEGIINKRPAEELIAKYKTEEAVAKAFLELKEYWNALLGKYSLLSSDDKLNCMVNIWNQYQCMVTFNMSRSASYFETGIGRGMGFRDSCQDLLGFVHLIPERARERILDIAATQFVNGSAYHQYQPLTKKGNSDIGSGFNDDPLWLIAGTSAYIRETGDLSILEEMVPYDNDMNVATTLFEHLTRSLNFTINHKGPHKLPLIGRADWNDCLTLNSFSTIPGESFQTSGSSEGPVAESVFIAGMFVKYAKEYAELCRITNRNQEKERALSEAVEMDKAILDFGWDGDWFIRAYDANGNKVGSRECEEGKIFIEPQGFCVLAGVGVASGEAIKALDSVKERLDSKYGIMLQQPAYSRYYLELGEISAYPPGYKENAGIFCHNNPWVSIAETVIGRGDRAFEYYKKICPSYLEDISEIHRTEPYIYSQMIAGADAVFHGEAKNSWLTGTAAWTFVSISQYILGLYPTYEGLRINPCLTKNFGDYKITRRFREGTYYIEVKNPEGIEKGVKELLVDGQLINDNIVPYQKGKTEYHVVVTMGSQA